MKIAVIIIRILVGLMFLFASVVVLFNLVPQPVLEGDVKLFNEGIAAAVYFVPLLKVIELICAIAFLSGRFIPLASVVIFPITVNILLFHAFLTDNVVMAVVILALNLYLAWSYRDYYKPLFAPKATASL